MLASHKKRPPYSPPHRTAVGQLERGERVARADTIAKLAGALRIDPGDLFEGIVWEPGDVRYGRFVEAESRTGDLAAEDRVDRLAGSERRLPGR